MINDWINNGVNVKWCDYIFIHRTPYFELKGLEPGQGYDIFLYAHNKKGKSLSMSLQAFTLKNPEKQTGNFKQNRFWPLFAH